MSRVLKQTISMVLALVMIVGMLPVNVLATEPENEPVVTEVPTEPEVTDAPAEPEVTETEGETEKSEEPDETEETEGSTEPEADPVAEVQAMIDALVIPNEDDYRYEADYKAALADLEKQLKAIDKAADKLTEEQLARVDAAKAEDAAAAINEYWLSKIPMVIVEGSGTESDPYIYSVGEGETVNGSQLYVWIGANTSWSTSRHYYADNTQFTQGGTAGQTVTGDTSKTFGAGTYAIYGTSRGSGLSYLSHNKDSSPKGYIEIREVKADEADMTLKDAPYIVKANLATYANLTADKIIAAAVATNNGTVTVNFRDYDEGTYGYGGHDYWTELTPENLSTFVASDDRTKFQLICGNTTKEITVNFEESRVDRVVTYTGTSPIEYVDDATLEAAVLAGLNPQIEGSTVTLVSKPAEGTGDAVFTVTVPGDVDHFDYSNEEFKVSVKMPEVTYTVTVKDPVGNGTATAVASSYAGEVVAITVTPNDTVSTDGSVDYVKSVVVTDAEGNNVTVTDNAFTMPESNVTVEVTFGTRSITVGETVIYMNSGKDKKDEYVANLVPAKVNYTLTGDGAQDTVQLQVYANWVIGNYYGDVSNLIGATHCDIPATKQIKLIWPAEGNLPEVSLEGIQVTILDSYRTVTYKSEGADDVVVGTELNAVYTVDHTPTWEGHTFDGWTDGTNNYANGDTITIAGNVVLTAKWTTNTYTVTWVNEDGTELDKATVEYGQPAPEYDGEAPTKEQTTEQVFTFAGWDKEVTAVTENTVITATYTAEARKYTLTFKNEQGETIETLTVAYGTEPADIVGIPAVPNKENTAQYTYTANDWGVVKVEGDATYIASYTETLRSYTLTFKNEQGEAIVTLTVPYGTKADAIEGIPEVPAKDATAEFTYTAKEWEVADVTGNAEYVASYTATRNSYTITWNAGDGVFANGSKTMTTTVEYGQTPKAPEEPTKAADDQTEWNFGGWGDVKFVTGDATYTATYTEGNAVEYKVTWYGEDGTTVIATADWAYGSTPTFAGELPTKEATAEYTYTFEKWVAVSGVAADGTIEGEASYKASFTATKNSYTVTWVIDGTEYKDTVEYGTVPTCGHKTDKEATAQYTYKFKSWDKDVVAVTGNVTYTAQYDTTVNKYTITWVDGNGKTVKTEDVEYGATPAYVGEAPTKAQTTEKVFTFNKTWAPAIVAVTQNATYTAQFDEAARPYTITWVDGDGKTIKTEQVGYGSVPAYTGDAPTKTATAEFVYTWNGGWTVAPVAVTGDASYTAAFDVALAAHNGTVSINGHSSEYSNKLNGLKAKVLDAAFGEGNYNAADYTVYMRVGKLIGSGTRDVDVETTSTTDKVDLLTRFSVGDNQEFVITHTNGATKVVSMKVEDSRPTPVVSASKDTIEFHEKEPVEDLEAQVIALFSISVGEGTAVAINDNWVTWSEAYEWPADDTEKIYTVTVQVPDSAAYQKSEPASVTVIVEDTTVRYTVKYVDGLGNELFSEVVSENLPTPTIDEPTRTYYKFAGWSSEVEETVTADVTYTATWEPELDNNQNDVADQEETYTVVYVLGNGAENITKADLAWGVETPTIDNPAWEGYNFKGWTPALASTIAAPAEGNEIVYTAQWTQAHAVIFMDRGSQYGEGVAVENEALLAEPTAPTWDADHDFLYWYYMDEGVEVEYIFTNPVTSSLTLYAKWRDDFNHNDIEDASEPHYDVVYVVDGVETRFENLLVDTDTPVFDADPSADGYQDPAKEGYMFAGWNIAPATKVTGDATYTAQWTVDANGNKVDDAVETVTFAITGSGKVTIGARNYVDGATYLYDSTNPAEISVTASPVASLSGTNYLSSTYVKSIAVDGTAAELAYNTGYTVTHKFTPTGAHTVEVVFEDIGFVFNDERVLKFYPGMPDVKNEDVYNAVVDTPELPGEYTIQYMAREATSVPITLTGLGLGSTVDALLNAAGLGTFDLDLPALWLDVNVETGDLVKDSVSLDQAVKQYLTADSVKAAWDEGGINGIRALLTKITDAATYHGAHNFGHNATESETKTEDIRLTYHKDAYYIEGETTIDLRDTRLPSYLKGNNVSVMYRDYTDEDLWTLIAPYVANAEGTQISSDVTCLDITDPYTYEGYGVAEYELTFKFAGNDDYKPGEGTFTVTVTKAPASIDIPNVNVNYGQAYSMLEGSYVTLGNAYGDPTEVTESMIQFVIGLDISELDVNADGVKGLNGQVQLILPEELQSLLDGIIGITGGNSSDGMEMTLSELVKYLEPIQDSSLDFLKQALNAITQITETGDITIKLGGDLPTDIGAYLYGAVSTNSNYETAYDVAYIVIKPAATQVYLDWNYTDTNGVFTYELLYTVDLGAAAYDDAAVSILNEEATALVNNVIFGLNANGELVTALYPAGAYEPEDIEKDLAMGAYTQLAFLADFGNEMYYAVPLARAFVLTPNVVDVEIGDETETNVFTYNKAPQGVEVSLNYSGESFQVDEQFLEVKYTGIQTNTQTYESTEAPTRAGAYLVTAIYIQKDEKGNVIGIGGDVEPLVIKPAESTISVTGGTFEYDGEAHGVTVESTSADVTIISGTVEFDGSITGLGIEDVTGVLNVDVPAWLDAVLAERFPNAYANGVTKADLLKKLTDSKEELIAISGITEEMVNSLTNLLNNLPADVQILFNDVATYTEPGLYAFVGVVTDSDYMPSYDTGLVVIQKKDLLLDMTDTTVTYDGKEHFVDVVCEPVTDYLTIIIDRENNIGNIVLDDDLMGLMETVEEALGRKLPESITLFELKTAVEDALEKIVGIPYLPIDAAKVFEEILVALNRLPDTSTVYINGALPVNAGEYEFYGASVSVEYKTQLTEGVLTIEEREVTITLDDQTKVYGEADPELTYTTENLVEGDELNVVASRAEGEDVGTYAITAAAQNDNYKIEVVDGVLTITPKAITAADVALVGSLTYNGQMQIQYITIPEEITYEITGNRATDAGDYTLTVTGTGNYTGTVELAWSIAKAETEIAAEPAAVENLVYTGEAQALVTAPEILGGTVEYSLDGETWSTEIPTATDAGEYTVSYRVKGDANHNDAAGGTVKVTISAKGITADDVVLNGSLTYIGAEQTQQITVAEGITYTVSGDKETNAGDYTLTVTGTGNYTGTVELAWNIAKAESEITAAPAAVENLVENGEAQALVTAGTAVGGTMEYSLDGETWTAEVPTATDAGEYTVYYRVKGDANHNDAAGGSLTVTVEPAPNTIQLPEGGQKGRTVVEINGKTYVVDEDGKIEVPQEMDEDLIFTSYSYNANTDAEAPDADQNAAAHKAYPDHMYVWYAEYDEENGCYKEAVEIEELRDFFQYAGTSIRYSTNASAKHGIRIITAVDESDRKALINGTLVKHEALAGWKLVEYGTVFKNITKSALAADTTLVYTGMDAGNASMAYGKYNGKNLDRILNRAGGNIQFTGMLVNLEDELLDDELLMRPYMVLESPDGEHITIHGGALQRNIGYVAWRNQGVGSAAAQKFIDGIIAKVYGE